MITHKHRITKFCQYEPLTILTQLYTEYRTITSSDLTVNFDRMTSHWNPPTPIYDLFQQLNDGKEFTEEGNEIINDRKLLCPCYKNLHVSELFNETLKTWQEKPYIHRTYANSVPFMTQQEEDCLSNKPTSRTTGYSNAIIDSIVHDKIQ